MCQSCGIACPTPPVIHFDRTCGVAEHIEYAADQAKQTFNAECVRGTGLGAAVLGGCADEAGRPVRAGQRTAATGVCLT